MNERDHADAWHFVWDERDGFWTWKRLSAAGEERAKSLYTFASFNVCVADAERAGFVNDTATIRRVRASELPAHSDDASAHLISERRRRPRNATG
jgi:hypothetical protein